MTDAAAPAIAVRDVGKCYHIYDRPQDRLKQSLWRGRRQFFREFWALRGVSFDVLPGQMVGIIGRNGSGKSTLLQIIAGTLTPSEGTARLSGRVAALLELGSGFNPDFTGRENVFMNGVILGLSQQQMAERFDAIADFADIGAFIDQPVKTYSSGMVVRLAFAVAVHVDAEVLIVDEALAVGDAPFQAKCYRRLEQLRQRGLTILLATHDTQTVAAMCNRALLLEAGQIAMLDTGKRVAEEYYRRVRQIELLPESSPAATARRKPAAPSTGKTAATNTPSQRDDPSGMADPAAILREGSGTRMGDGRAEIVGLTVYNAAGEPDRVLKVREPFSVEVRITCRASLANPQVGVALRDVQSRLLLGAHTLYENVRIGPIEAGRSLALRFEMQMNLNPGKYLLMAGVAEHEDFTSWKDCDVRFDCCPIDVIGKDRAWSLVDSPVRISLMHEDAPAHRVTGNTAADPLDAR